jgi:hypothetical protein
MLAPWSQIMRAARMRHRRKRKGNGHGAQFFLPGSPYHGTARHARRRNVPPEPAQSGRDTHNEGSSLPPTPQEPPDKEATNDQKQEAP